MSQSIKLVFKNYLSLKYKLSEIQIWCIEDKEDFINLALNGYEKINDLKKYRFIRDGNYRIPLKDLNFAGLEI